MTRRDRCHLVGVRAAKLSGIEAAWAWSVLAGLVENLGERDIPKFRDVISAIRVATIEGARIGDPAPTSTVEMTRQEVINELSADL